MTMNVTALAAMPVHEAADLFPMMEEADGKDPGKLAQLAADMQANGCHTPVVLYQGAVLDGRNRIAAARLVGIDSLPTTEYTGTDPVSYVLSLNLHRRHLDVYALAELSLKLRELRAREAEARQLAGTLASPDAKVNAVGKTAEVVAKDLGGAISGPTLERAWTVMDRAPEKWEEAKRTGTGVRTVYNEVTNKKPVESKPDAERVLSLMEGTGMRWADFVDDLANAKANEEQWGVAVRIAKSMLLNAETHAGRVK